MSGILVRGKGEGIISGLSLLFKLELSCILCGIIIATIAGEDLIMVLSRRDYSNYSAVLIVMLIYVAFATAYRLLEMIINTNSKQTIFLVIWPISGMSVIATYVLVHRVGLIAVLLFPTLEIALRVMLLATAFRQYGTFRVFDPLRTLPLILAATIIAIAGRIALRLLGADHSMLLDFAVAAVAALLFLGGVCICKILRPSEYEVLGAVFPERWRPTFSFILNWSALVIGSKEDHVTYRKERIDIVCFSSRCGIADYTVSLARAMSDSRCVTIITSSPLDERFQDLDAEMVLPFRRARHYPIDIWKFIVFYLARRGRTLLFQSGLLVPGFEGLVVRILRFAGHRVFISVHDTLPHHPRLWS